MTDIVEKLRELSTPERRKYGVPADVAMDEAADTITALRAENERLREAITVAIRQHEEGSRGLAYRTLCEAVYGAQA